MSTARATSPAPASDAGMQAQADSDQYLTFLLAAEEYGVHILRVREIRGWGKVTPIPNTPDHILGVINLRGTVVPVVDLRERFGLAAADYGPTTVVIVVKVAGAERERTVGIVVDAVCDVCNVGTGEIQPPPDLGQAVSTEFVTGLATVGERMVILLDIDHLISDGVMQDAGRAAPCPPPPALAAAAEPA